MAQAAYRPAWPADGTMGTPPGPGDGRSDGRCPTARSRGKPGSARLSLPRRSPGSQPSRPSPNSSRRSWPAAELHRPSAGSASAATYRRRPCPALAAVGRQQGRPGRRGAHPGPGLATDRGEQQSARPLPPWSPPRRMSALSRSSCCCCTSSPSTPWYLTPPAYRYLSGLDHHAGLLALHHRHARGLRRAMEPATAQEAEQLEADLVPLPAGTEWTDLLDPALLEAFRDVGP